MTIPYLRLRYKFLAVLAVDAIHVGIHGSALDMHCHVGTASYSTAIL